MYGNGSIDGQTNRVPNVFSSQKLYNVLSFRKTNFLSEQIIPRPRLSSKSSYFYQFNTNVYSCSKVTKFLIKIEKQLNRLIFNPIKYLRIL